MLATEIKKFVLANAYDHDGKAQSGAIVGKLIRAGAISKADIGKTIPDIIKIIKEVSKLSLKQQETELKKLYPAI